MGGEGAPYLPIASQQPCLPPCWHPLTGAQAGLVPERPRKDGHERDIPAGPRDPFQGAKGPERKLPAIKPFLTQRPRWMLWQCPKPFELLIPMPFIGWPFHGGACMHSCCTAECVTGDCPCYLLHAVLEGHQRDQRQPNGSIGESTGWGWCGWTWCIHGVDVWIPTLLVVTLLVTVPDDDVITI